MHFSSLMFVINRSKFVAWHFSMWNSICMQEIYSGTVRSIVLEWSVCSTGWGTQNLFFHPHSLVPQKRSKSTVNSYRYFSWRHLRTFYLAYAFVAHNEWTVYYFSSNYLVFLSFLFFGIQQAYDVTMLSMCIALFTCQFIFQNLNNWPICMKLNM